MSKERRIGVVLIWPSIPTRRIALRLAVTLQAVAIVPEELGDFGLTSSTCVLKRVYHELIGLMLTPPSCADEASYRFAGHASNARGS